MSNDLSQPENAVEDLRREMTETVAMKDEEIAMLDAMCQRQHAARQQQIDLLRARFKEVMAAKQQQCDLLQARYDEQAAAQQQQYDLLQAQHDERVAAQQHQYDLLQARFDEQAAELASRKQQMALSQTPSDAQNGELATVRRHSLLLKARLEQAGALTASQQEKHLLQSRLDEQACELAAIRQETGLLQTRLDDNTRELAASQGEKYRLKAKLNEQASALHLLQSRLDGETGDDAGTSQTLNQQLHDEYSADALKASQQENLELQVRLEEQAEELAHVTSAKDREIKALVSFAHEHAAEMKKLKVVYENDLNSLRQQLARTAPESSNVTAQRENTHALIQDQVHQAMLAENPKVVALTKTVEAMAAQLQLRNPDVEPLKKTIEIMTERHCKAIEALLEKQTELARQVSHLTDNAGSFRSPSADPSRRSSGARPSRSRVALGIHPRPVPPTGSVLERRSSHVSAIAAAHGILVLEPTYLNVTDTAVERASAAVRRAPLNAQPGYSALRRASHDSAEQRAAAHAAREVNIREDEQRLAKLQARLAGIKLGA
ncbi:hypothetical protein HKX48_004386 [Thoreauomyces humboldtii]|nr:hypothetical protein HKX48_004386 [Thoreauomyces humboldtii]